MITTSDAFLGGRLVIQQPQKGYRAATDPVFLAASVEARAGQTVLDFGAGVGTAGLCLATRVEGLSLTGYEVQAEYAELARANAVQADLAAEFVICDVFDLPAPERQRQFDIVMTNPPYFDAAKGTASDDVGRDVAFRSSAALEEWIAIAAKRVAAKGYLYIVHRGEALQAILQSLPKNFGGLEIRPLAPRAGRPASRVLVRARQGSKAPLTLHAPRIIHRGDTHQSDVPSYAEWAESVLRHGAALPWC